MRLVTGLMLMGSILLSGAEGVWLCVGDKVHVTVEPSHHNQCAKSHTTQESQDEDAVYSDLDDGASCTSSCVDVPLTIDTSSLIAKPLKVDHLFSVLSLDSMLTDYSAPLPADTRGLVRPPCEAMLRLAPSLLEKRTIVLRV